MSDWRLAQARVVGSAHKMRSLPCQDAVAVIEHDHCLCLSLSDGAGSGGDSEFGSRLITDGIIYRFGVLSGCSAPNWKMDKVMAKSLARQALKEAREQLLVTAAQHQISPRDLAATLLFVVCTDHWIIGLQVGDGAS